MTEKKRSLGPLALVLILSASLFAFFLMISGVFFLYKTPDYSSSSSPSFFDRDGYVGVMEIKGVILESKKALRRLEKLEEDDRIKAVVLRLNSPGGSVAPSQEIYEAVRAFKKPIVVSMGSVAASGAYYIAAGAPKIYANPGTITGSIGVIMEFANLEKLYDWAKIERYVVKTGKFKDAGAEFRRMSADERALFQSMIDDVLVQFKQAIVTGRKLPMARVTELADGRIFSGHQAKEVHLVDELGTLNDAVNEAGRLGKIKGKPKLIYVEKQRKGLLDLVLGDSQESPDYSESAPSGVLRLVNLISMLTTFLTDEGPVLDSGPGVYLLFRPTR